MKCRICGEPVFSIYSDACEPGTRCAERQWGKVVQEKQAEIERLRVALAEAATIIRAAKRQWAPHTDNSDADMWLRRFDTPTKPIEWSGSGVLDCPQIT